MGTLWLSTMMDAAGAPIQPAKGDRRFASEEWKKSPLHDFLKQSYLINIRYVNDLIERSSVDERTRGRMRFFESLSKSCGGNFCATPRRQTGGRPSPAEWARPRAAMSRRAPTEALTVELVHDRTREIET